MDAAPPMDFRPLVAIALGCTSCAVPGLQVGAGLLRPAVTGFAGLAPAGSTGDIAQDVESAFGLGAEQDSPYVRAEVELGPVLLAASGFTFDEQGSGTLERPFGNLGAGTLVDTELRFTNARVCGAFPFALGPLSIGPGLAVDAFDLEMEVRSSFGAVAEQIEVTAPVPMPFVRAEAGLGIVAAVGELGYITVPEIDGIEGTFWDAELALELRPSAFTSVFFGYRHIDIDGEGTVDGRDFEVDLQAAGWMVGGRFRF